MGEIIPFPDFWSKTFQEFNPDVELSRACDMCIECIKECIVSFYHKFTRRRRTTSEQTTERRDSMARAYMCHPMTTNTKRQSSEMVHMPLKDREALMYHSIHFSIEILTNASFRTEQNRVVTNRDAPSCATADDGTFQSTVSPSKLATLLHSTNQILDNIPQPISSFSSPKHLPSNLKQEDWPKRMASASSMTSTTSQSERSCECFDEALLPWCNDKSSCVISNISDNYKYSFEPIVARPYNFLE